MTSEDTNGDAMPQTTESRGTTYWHTTMEWAIWRHPQARLVEEGRWVAFIGAGEQVLPAGLQPSDHDWAETPTRLRSSVSDAFEHFRLLASLDATEHPAHLLDHVRRFGVSVLCRDHGLPMWHHTPERSRPENAETSLTGEVPKGASCYSPGVPGMGTTGLLVEHAVAIARFFDAVLDASIRIRRRQQVSWHLVDTITAMPGVPISKTFLAEWNRDEGLGLPARRRQLVSLAAEGFLKQTGTRFGVSWVGRRRPELVMKAEDVWGVYALEMVRRLSLDDEQPATYRCAVCGRPVMLVRRPRDGDLTYCRTPECQRERQRRNKARQRNERNGGAR
ncbi:MAG: hypothetical protein M3Q47_12150 [Actinomycetota bacterium]|nr:hypothetical protein [Actinomycetota bacterium]